MIKALLDLSKAGMIYGVLICTLLGYSLGLKSEFKPDELILLLAATILLACGSFALNQVQEASLDKKMKRTQNRPIPRGIITRTQGLIFAVFMLSLSFLALSFFGTIVVLCGATVVILYNGFYTMIWKPKWVFGAVPGAIPGAMPVVLGYAAASGTIFTSECFYLFMVMFAWQMPHFWALAIKYRDDYGQAGIPTLPSTIGAEGTIYHIGTYLLLYVAIVLSSPIFVQPGAAYLFVALPLGIKLVFEFKKLFDKKTGENWFPFFMWVNVSLIIFLAVPVIDKWVLPLALR